MQSKVTWKDGMAFEAQLDGFSFGIDADEKFGGRGLGPKPKGLLLTSLVGCTGMDVVAILRKMKLEPTQCDVTADGDLTEDHPKRFSQIRVRYDIAGEDLPAKKVARAVRLSEENYCGVRASLAPEVEVVSEIVLNGETLVTAEAG
ncbi:MAG: OsmC family protein [Deltaproteobacteria bacterium]|nr:OsmC family protein [Deltaproteobacteria bacterium]